MATIAPEMMRESAAQGFEAFYEHWFTRVYNYVRHRTGSAVRADEIVSDVFSRVLDAWSRFDPQKGDRRSWLFAIAFRAVADHYRSEKRRRWFGLGLLSSHEEKGARPAGKLEDADDQERLMIALDQLNDQQREIVSLKFFSQMTNRAIAKLLGLTESNVAVILYRSIRRMRRSFPGEADHG